MNRSLVIFGTLEIIGVTRANGINGAFRIFKKLEKIETPRPFGGRM